MKTKLILFLLIIIGLTSCSSTGVSITELNQNISGDLITNNISNYYVNGTLTGWAEYKDTQYNNTNRFTATGGNSLPFPNNAQSTILSQIPTYINQSGGFYNGSKFIGRNGDMYAYAFRGVAEPQSVNSYCQFTIDIGGAVGELPLRLLSFPKGSGIESIFEFSSIEYTLDTWETNGGEVLINCNNDVEFFNISYKSVVIHKAN